MWAPGLEKQSSGLAPHYYETVELIMSLTFVLTFQNTSGNL